MVYYAIALALYMGSSTREVLRCLLEGLRWLWGAEAVRVARVGFGGRTAGSGSPAAPAVRGAGAADATPASEGGVRDWRLVSLDGSCLEVADTAANRSEFGVPGASRGASASRNCVRGAGGEGTHVLFGARLGPTPRG